MFILIYSRSDVIVYFLFSVSVQPMDNPDIFTPITEGHGAVQETGDRLM